MSPQLRFFCGCAAAQLGTVNPKYNKQSVARQVWLLNGHKWECTSHPQRIGLAIMACPRRLRR